jgi:hypothetical protein
MSENLKTSNFLFSVPDGAPVEIEPFHIGVNIKELTERSAYHREQRAYLTGVLDSEGSIEICRYSLNKDGFHQSPTYYVQVQVSSTDRPCIEAFYNYFKVGCFYASLIRKNMKVSRRIYHFHWQVKGENAIKVLITLLPFLRLKRKQAILAIAFQKNKVIHRGRNPLTEEDLLFREKFRQTIHELNRSPIL